MNSQLQLAVDAARRGVKRRDWMKLAAAGIAGTSMSGWLEQLAAQTPEAGQKRRSVILLWMSGGPSQIDTFDVKPDHVNGGPLKPIATSVPGIQICETLPKLSQMMEMLWDTQGGFPKFPTGSENHRENCWLQAPEEALNGG